MSRRPGSRPHGQIRQSQLITSFGPGSMLDLPNHSVLVGGLDSWSTGGDEIIEPRLVDKLKELFDPPLQSLKLYTPPPDQDDPTAPQTGITAWQFPEWFITQDVDSEASRGTVSGADAGASSDADQGQVHRRPQEEAQRRAGSFRASLPQRTYRRHRLV